MVEKGYLSREQEGNAYLFSPAVNEDVTSSGILKDVLERVFDGSAKSLMLQLLGSDSISPDEREELKDLINEAVNNEKKQQ